MLSDAERQQFDQIAGALSQDASFKRASRTAERAISERPMAKPAKPSEPSEPSEPSRLTSNASAVATQRGAWDQLCDWAERRWAARQQQS
jgi:hypothetical protein